MRHPPPSGTYNTRTSALKAELLTGCCSHGNSIPGCPSQGFSPPAFLHPKPTSLSFIEQELLNIGKRDGHPFPSSLSHIPFFFLSFRNQSWGKAVSGREGGREWGWTSGWWGRIGTGRGHAPTPPACGPNAGASASPIPSPDRGPELQLWEDPGPRQAP